MKLKITGNLGQQDGICDYISHKVEETLDQGKRNIQII